MSGYYRSISNHEKSIDAADRALAEMQNLGNTTSVSFGTTLLNAATAYRAAGRVERASDLSEDALAIYQAYLPEKDPRLAGLYNNLSALYGMAGQNEKACGLLKKAYDILSAHNPAEAAIAGSNLAQFYLEAGRHEEAAALLKEAVSVLSGDGSMPPDPHYSAVVAAQGVACYTLGAYGDAIAFYEKALVLIKENYGENADYATVGENLALAYEAIGNGDAAQAWRIRSQAVRQKL
jgi:tetratricopeptide (TPR) repeat protein